MLMRLALVLLLSLWPGLAFAADCYWVSDRGDTLDRIYLPDYTYAFQPAGEWGTLCVTMRSDEQTSIACDNGFEAELEGLGEQLRVGDLTLNQVCRPEM